MGSHPDKNWRKFHHRADKVAVKAVPAYSEKHLNQNWQENAASLSQNAPANEPAGFYGGIVAKTCRPGQKSPWSETFYCGNLYFVTNLS